MLLITGYAFYTIVIALHLYFVVLEMVLWKTKAPKVFGISSDFAHASAALASNQGLYNGFLLVALIAGVIIADTEVRTAFRLYGLVCIVVAGMWGAITVNPRIFFVQAMPAILALILFKLA